MSVFEVINWYCERLLITFFHDESLIIKATEGRAVTGSVFCDAVNENAYFSNHTIQGRGRIHCSVR